MTMKQYLLGRKKNSSKIQVYANIHDAQIEATDGWSVVFAYNVESAKKKYEDNYKQLHEKSGRRR